MKVYLITVGAYADYEVVGVALTHEKALAFVADDYDPKTGRSKRGRWAEAYQIEEMDAL